MQVRLQVQQQVQQQVRLQVQLPTPHRTNTLKPVFQAGKS
jgi:hypothetical protein